MKKYEADRIRNIALLGHGGCGKTTATEAAIFTAKLINRMGRVEDGNTVSDFNKEEVSRNISVSTSVIPIEWKNHKINLIDTPGYFDFIGEVQSAIKVAGGMIIFVDATSGIEVGTEKAWDFAEQKKAPTFIFINKMDRDNSAFKKGIEQAKPILLEPVVEVRVNVPDEYMGDVMGDLNKRRGRIIGMEPQTNGDQLIIAEVPQSEMFKYATDLRSMTQARGAFTMSFVRYEEAPQMISEKVVMAARAAKE